MKNTEEISAKNYFVNEERAKEKKWNNFNADGTIPAPATKPFMQRAYTKIGVSVIVSFVIVMAVWHYSKGK